MLEPLHKTEQWKPHSWWQLLITLPWCIGLVLLVHGSIQDRDIAKRQKTATGRITSHEPANHNQYGYVFSVDGRQYSGSEIPELDRKIGDTVLVFYDPRNPSRSALSDFSEVADANDGPILFLAIGIGVLAVVIYRRRRTSTGVPPPPRRVALNGKSGTMPPLLTR